MSPPAKTFVVPDIHGRFDLLDTALAEIERQATGGTVVFTGDYVDRGPDSAAVVARLIAGPKDGWRWICLKGNHEDMMVGAMAGDYEADWWIGNGGGATVASYGGSVRTDHLMWMDRLPLWHRDQHRIYVHAGIDPTLPMSEQAEKTLLWVRCAKRQNYDHPEGYVVHGHTPFDDGPIVLDGRANLDTGAFFTGRLVVAVFDDATAGAPIKLIDIQTTREPQQEALL